MKLKVLVTTPLCVPSYFNAGHRLHLFEVSGYLRKKGYEVDAVDIASLNVTWKHWADLLVQKKYDVIAIMNDFDLIEGMGRLLNYVREFSPTTRTVTFGRLSSGHSEIFLQYKNLDGIVKTGDYESGVAEFIEYLNGNKIPAGVKVQTPSGWIEPLQPGILLPVTEWVLPSITEIDYSSVDNLYRDDQMKFCGIPDRRELVIPMARGCPVGCNFCEVWQREGLKERRLPVAQVITYIEESFAAQPFEYVSMYAPTFTLKKQWVREMCDEFIARGNKWAWKCTTTVFHLDRELVLLMGQARCVRISIGLETLEEEALKALPGHKHEAKERFDELYAWCQEAGIELNCFIIVGLPGTTVAGTRATFEYLRSKPGVRIRPSIMSDYSMLHEGMTEAEALEILGRHILPPNAEFTPEERAQLYELVFGKEPNLTQVGTSIPKHNEWLSLGRVVHLRHSTLLITLR